MDILSHQKDKSYWAKKASKVFTKMVKEKLDFVDEIIFEFSELNDLMLKAVVRRPVKGEEIDLIKQEFSEIKKMLKFISPSLDKNLSTSIWTREALEKFRSNAIQKESHSEVLNNLKSFVNEEVKESLKNIGDLFCY